MNWIITVIASIIGSIVLSIVGNLLTKPVQDWLTKRSLSSTSNQVNTLRDKLALATSLYNDNAYFIRWSFKTLYVCLSLFGLGFATTTGGLIFMLMTPSLTLTQTSRLISNLLGALMVLGGSTALLVGVQIANALGQTLDQVINFKTYSDTTRAAIARLEGKLQGKTDK